ncbi:hypothetical protein [Leptospira jelokensis]|uniref:hypothetical protein n=1 Tax=Leptospira jelokensis TaxID=2484931 RepID=UPI0010910F98|nr:hypothetical protein [Leptospira jelokensis]TGM00172.1 hypothetical protein EHQ79_14100 [Leptospira jelokensis]
MKYTFLVCLISFFPLFSVFAETSAGSSGKFGLGLTLFGPTGISGKYVLNQKSAVEGSLGLGTIGNGTAHLHVVYLYNIMDLSPSLHMYVGGGGVYQERNAEGNSGRGRGLGNLFRDRSHEPSLGIRAPLGLSFLTEDRRFELSGEVYMQVFVTGKNGVDVGLALAGRYYF